MNTINPKKIHTTNTEIRNVLVSGTKKKAKEIHLKRHEKRLAKQKIQTNQYQKSSRKIEHFQKPEQDPHPTESFLDIKHDNTLYNLTTPLLTSIPRELVLIILSLLSAKELTRLIMVCEFFQDILLPGIPQSPRLYSKNIVKSGQHFTVNWTNYELPKEREEHFLYIRFDSTKERFFVPIEEEKSGDNKLVISGKANLPPYIPTAYYYLQLVVFNSCGSGSSRWVRIK